MCRLDLWRETLGTRRRSLGLSDRLDVLVLFAQHIIICLELGTAFLEAITDGCHQTRVVELVSAEKRSVLGVDGHSLHKRRPKEVS